MKIRSSSRWDFFQQHLPYVGSGLYDTISVFVIGVGTGLMVIGFKQSIAFINRYAFGPLREALPGGNWSILFVPLIGGLIVGLLQQFWVRPEKYHGVASIMVSIALANGRLPYKRAPVKVLTSALSIGFGASVGPEDPSVQIGANWGAFVARKLRVDESRLPTLVAMGAASGIAAAFNAPIAGVFFSLELLLGHLHAGAIGMVLFGSVLSSVVTQALVGATPAFPIPAYAFGSPLELVFYLGLGLLAGLTAFAYIKAIYLAHDHLHHSRLPRWLRPVLIGALVGLAGVSFPQVFGDSYETISEILRGEQLVIWLLLTLLLLKIVLTALSLSAGFIGGVFAPSLFLGAALGGAYGVFIARLFPGLHIQPSAFALVGMAAVLAGTVHAPLTAIMLLFEMTNDYRIILPLMFAVAVSLFTSRWLHPASVYETGLRRDGLHIHRGQDIDILEALSVEEVMDRSPLTVPWDTPLGQIHLLFDKAHSHGLPVVDDQGRLFGVITLSDLENAVHDSPDNLKRPVRDFCSRKLVVAHPDESVHQALKRMGMYDIGRMPVVQREDPTRIVGWLSRMDIIQAYQMALSRYKLTRHRANQIKLGLISGVSVFEFVVDKHSPLAHKKLKEIELPQYSLIASIERQGNIIIPHGNARLLPGDLVAVISHDNDREALERLFRGKQAVV